MDAQSQLVPVAHFDGAGRRCVTVSGAKSPTESTPIAAAVSVAMARSGNWAMASPCIAMQSSTR